MTADVFEYLDTSVTRMDKLKKDNSCLKTLCLYKLCIILNSVFVFILSVFIGLIVYFDPSKTLQNCAYYSDIDCLNELLSEDPDAINKPDNFGNTALHWACKRGNMTVIQYLLSYGSEIDHENHVHTTPLFWATYSNNV